MPVFLHGLTLQNYRGIGPKPQRMAPFRDFNFFIGANNAGKSTILNFLKSHLQSKQPYGPLDRYAGGTKGEPTMAIALPAAEFTEIALSGMSDQSRQLLEEEVTKLCEGLCQHGFLWFSTTDTPNSFFKEAPKTKEELTKILPSHAWQRIWHAYTGQGSGSLQEHWAPQIFSRLVDLLPTNTPKVDLVVAIREVGATNEKLNDFSGRGLIDHLARLQSPGHDTRSDRDTFQKINKFSTSCNESRRCRNRNPPSPRAHTSSYG